MLILSMLVDVGRLGWPAGSSVTILKGDHLRTILLKFGPNRPTQEKMNMGSHRDPDKSQWNWWDKFHEIWWTVVHYWNSSTIHQIFMKYDWWTFHEIWWNVVNYSNSSKIHQIFMKHDWWTFHEFYDQLVIHQNFMNIHKILFMNSSWIKFMNLHLWIIYEFSCTSHEHSWTIHDGSWSHEFHLAEAGGPLSELCPMIPPAIQGGRHQPT